ncbi:hypothetical protein DEFDS_1710 [Deferribacter desulfuricans SSM1]|uniref:Uncharacterized protein n=1 Tax=Deferribacter desulfuricans (strain DSM 14783 / JCM 11476 / NBRC 101012 / SSM1) TaxID=639282 RepID=D3P8X6_DEFDS|nr:hypothetical protein [Deferribacter desulfuricans]BAI81166.1 hypothetical protein DEFDS_1710 [Deferribacter desulfuricans SSM1]
MKSEFINFYIHNPSPNLHILGKRLKRKGHKVVFTSDSIYYPKFYNSIYLLENKNIEKIEPSINTYFCEKEIFKFKRNILDKVFYFNKTKYTSLFFNSIVKQNGNFKEYNPIEDTDKKNFDDIISSNDEAVIILSYLDSNISDRYSIKGKRFYLFKLTLENEFLKIFSDSSFYIIDNSIEFFIFENYLIVISENDNLDVKKLYKYLNKYTFEVESLGSYVKNIFPWFMKYKVGNKYLIFLNDYSLFNISVKVCDEWFDKLERAICLEKLQ